MQYRRQGETIELTQPELDIYDAVELAALLKEMARSGQGAVALDLRAVEELSMAGLQVLLAARRSFASCRIEGLESALGGQPSALGRMLE